MKPIRFDVCDATGATQAVVRGTVSEDALTLAHPYPDFDVEAGWTATSRSVSLTFNGPRNGQRIPCSRG